MPSLCVVGEDNVVTDDCLVISSSGVSVLGRAVDVVSSIFTDGDAIGSDDVDVIAGDVTLDCDGVVAVCE